MTGINRLAEDLEEFLGSDSVFKTQEELIPYSLDPYTKIEKKPLLAVKIHQPQQLNRIAFLLKRFNQEKQRKVSITPRGCGLGVSQGTLSSDSIIVDLSELKEVAISEDGETIDVQCGATFEQISRILNENDLCLGMEPTTSPRCTVGGFIASGGLGFSSIKYGSISTHIRNLRVFLSIGSMIET
ncbi:MAG: FAD-dependent oxidoreductase, partial [Candidatus Hodarchaeota archaeon]